jgi:hypothetical protein
MTNNNKIKAISEASYLIHRKHLSFRNLNRNNRAYSHGCLRITMVFYKSNNKRQLLVIDMT